MKKSVFKTIAEAFAFDGLRGAKMPTKRVDTRKLTVDEIKQCILEEFGEAKDADDEEVLEPKKGWGDAEIAKEIDWIKKLDIKEFFKK
jgi:hypothetical protein